MKNYLFLLLFIFSGCTIINHWDQITVMREYSREKTEQRALMDEAQAKLEQLTADYANGLLVTGLSDKHVKKTYGDPMIITPEGQGEKWLYRTGLLKPLREKIFLYFDQQHLLIKAERIEVDG